ADVLFPTHAGPEIGVASTKAFTSQVAALTALAVAAAAARGRIDAAEEARLAQVLLEAPRLLSDAAHLEDEIRALAPELAKARDILYLGRGALYPLALEGALKLKEISYIHAEGYAAGELKHGPIVLITDGEGAAHAPAGAKVIVGPTCEPILQPLVYAPPIQLLAYYVAVQKG